MSKTENLVKQLEYYFSDLNLSKDSFFHGLIAADKQVSIFLKLSILRVMWIFHTYKSVIRLRSLTFLKKIFSKQLLHQKQLSLTKRSKRLED